LFFTSDEFVISTANMHLTLVPWSYAFLGMAMVSVSAFNAIGKPTPGMLISMSRTIGVYAPLAFLLAWLFGLQGVFLAAFLANIVAGTLGFFWFRMAFRQFRSTVDPETESA
jgi:Na+-driven multidrug efflux pump